MPRTWLVAGAMVGALAGSAARDAAAQPGQTPISSPASAQPMAPIQVTQEEYEILQRGEYGAGEMIGGGLLGTFYGLGLGQAIQGRWAQDGWKFTFGELGSASMLFYGMIRCMESSQYQEVDSCNGAGWYIVGGAIGYAVFRIWDTIDVWSTPATHNRKLRELRMRTGYGLPRWGVFAAPSKGDGGIAGITLRF